MRDILGTLQAQLRPAHTALVIVDMQNDFCAEGGHIHRQRGSDMSGNVVIADNIEHLAAVARRAGMPVVWLRSVYDFKYLADAHIAKRGQEGCCLEGSWGVDWFRIQPQPQDLVVQKHRFSGFQGTPLHTLLRGHGVKTLLMTGVATNVCVDSTLREGFFLGYHIVVAEDCVGSTNRAGHEGTLSTVRVNIGTVAGSHALIELIEADAAAGRPATA